MTHSRSSMTALCAAALLSALPLAHGQLAVPGTVGNPDAGVIHTGLQLRPGDGFEVVATGLVTIFQSGGNYFGPDGEAGAFSTLHWMPSQPNGALIGEIAGQPKFLGSYFSGGAWAKGELVLGVNDNYHADNAGSFDVALRAIPGSVFWTAAGVTPGAVLPGVLAGGGGGGPAGTFTVGGTSGCSGWVNTGLNLNAGDTLMTSATGLVTAFLSGGNYYGPNGEPNQFKNAYCVDNAEIVSLIARIGNGAPFKLGAAFSGVVTGGGGLLQLGINDDYYPDNAGSFQVSVSLAATSGGSTGGGTGPVDRPLRDTLTVNGSAGAGAAREVTRDRFEPLHIELELSQSLGTRSALYLWPVDLCATLDEALNCDGAIALPISASGTWEAPGGVGRRGRFYLQAVTLASGTESRTDRVLLVQY